MSKVVGRTDLWVGGALQAHGRCFSVIGASEARLMFIERAFLRCHFKIAPGEGKWAGLKR
jgi:hypothetical protein